MQKTNHPFIVIDNTTRGIHPTIIGTGIRVLDIVIESVYKGYSVDQIIEYHPHLKLEQIHDALSYYYEHQKEIDEQIKRDQHYFQQLKKAIAKDQPSTMIENA